MKHAHMLTILHNYYSFKNAYRDVEAMDAGSTMTLTQEN